jgi:hypothetical protein
MIELTPPLHMLHDFMIAHHVRVHPFSYGIHPHATIPLPLFSGLI